MRIPTSVFVMSVVTAMPFGLACWTTLHPTPRTDPPPSHDERAAQAEAEYRREAEIQPAASENQSKQALFSGLLGSPGTLGSYFDGIGPGTPRDLAEAVKTRTNGDKEPFRLDVVYTNDEVRVIGIRSERCSDLEHAIRSAWGEGEVWIDTATHTQARFFAKKPCALVVVGFVDIEQFLDRTMTASIPIAAIGKTINDVPVVDGFLPDSPGLDHTVGSLVVIATTDPHNTIIGLSAEVQADPVADETIRARLDQLFGKGKQGPDPGEWDYRGTPGAHYLYRGGYSFIEIGRP
jgi:hypothetical protein